MKLARHLFCLCFIILVGCASSKGQNPIYILDNELSLAYKNIDDSLKKKRSKLLFSGEQEVSSCNTYLDLVSTVKLEEDLYNQQVKSEYLTCDALKILSDSLEFSQEKVNVSDLGDELLSKLDIRSFSSSLNRSGTEVSHTLRSLYPSQTSYTDNVAELQSEDWAFTLEVVAIARINDNLSPDWIVWVFDESKSGKL